MRVERGTSPPEALREIANSDEVQDIARQQAKDIQRDARRLAPARTGQLRRGIVIEQITDLNTGREGYAVGWNDRAFYGPFVENGGEHATPRPHMVPAAVKNGATGGGER